MNGNSFVDDSNELDEYKVSVFTEPSYKNKPAASETITLSVANKKPKLPIFSTPQDVAPLPPVIDFSEFEAVAQAEEDELKKEEPPLFAGLEERSDSPVVGVIDADELPLNQEAVIDQSTVAPEFEETKEEVAPADENGKKEMEDEPEQPREVPHTNGTTNGVNHSEAEEADRQEARDALEAIHEAVPMTEDAVWADDKEEKKEEKEEEKKEEPEKKEKKKKEKKGLGGKGKATQPNRVSNRLSTPLPLSRKSQPIPRRFKDKKSERKLAGYPSYPLSVTAAHEFNNRSGSQKLSGEVNEHAGVVFLAMTHRLLSRAAIVVAKKKTIDEKAVDEAISASIRVPRIYE